MPYMIYFLITMIIYLPSGGGKMDLTIGKRIIQLEVKE